ncbi:MAG: hypothetical protein ACR2HX_25145 [Pyrinomonadaceae bacterium]
MKEGKRIAEATAGRYRKARKKEKGVILNEFVELTGFARSYAAMVLRNQGRVVAVNRRYGSAAISERSCRGVGADQLTMSRP